VDLLDSGDIVDGMISDGMKVVDEAKNYVTKELSKPIYGVVAAFSGGDDSIVVTHFANEYLDDVVTFNADTLVGLKPTRDHIDKCVETYKWSAEIIQATAEGKPKSTGTERNRFLRDHWRDGNSQYEECVLNHGFGGPQMHPRMYQRLKERQLMKLRRKLAAGNRGGRIIVISGIRHDESSVRAGYKRAFQDVPKQGVTWVNPFYWRTAQDFALYREEFGLPRNPVKQLCGISGECCCGTFGSQDEREAYKKVDPEFYQYLADLEAKVRERFPWGWGEGPPQWYMDKKRGQKFLWEFEDLKFQPMCVGCNNGRR
jgi:3'-phosphoadenosine 5'-phosphosulfate sulfotransferase (PAPS reductase)/FAD synthetase